MTYEQQFKKPEFYYQKINRLVSTYKTKGYGNLVQEWERQVNRIADMPDLRNLASKADHIYSTIA